MTRDYLAASSDEGTRGGTPLTANSSPSDAAGAVEILKLVGNPSAHRKRLDELLDAVAKADQRIAEATRREIELAKQVAELAKLRAEFDRQLAVDRENHIAKTQAAERDLVAKLEEAGRFLDDLVGMIDGLYIFNRQPEVAS
jgi:hypothetical protein